MRRELAKIGNNLNQVAYHLNVNHPVSTAQIQSRMKSLRKHLPSWFIFVGV
ncbi:plasmid mobilization relaxosome protein MobC [Pseudodesulfovibrio tunisiensis]|uniref:plasmid mobilization relaxosome protein MobC n=1 Tax=Pseudodesulfovibrio tunisiensis TaxID=463192 RepID=UPI003C729CFA